MSRLLTIGTFDIPHAGHAAFLRKCEAFADTVMVGVNTDEFVKSYKGVAPEFTEHERIALIRAMGYQAFLNPGPGHHLIAALRPDIVAIGTDWARKDYYAQIATPLDYFDEHGIAMLYLPYTPGISSSAIRARLGR